jgi:hypothetical protein
MVVKVLASLPLDSHFVPTWLEKISHKKIAGVALNILERLIHWLCSWLYSPYKTLHIAKQGRVHTFSDGIVKLIDTTVKGIAKTEGNYVSLRNRIVHFNLNTNIQTTFARKENTNYVIVRDDLNKRTNWYQIVEKEISRPGNRNPMEKIWHVNANLIYRFKERVERDVYLVQQSTR